VRKLRLLVGMSLLAALLTGCSSSQKPANRVTIGSGDRIGMAIFDSPRGQVERIVRSQQVRAAGE
jgi:protein involved in polysaccharide export with SLBB domain